MRYVYAVIDPETQKALHVGVSDRDPRADGFTPPVDPLHPTVIVLLETTPLLSTARQRVYTWRQRYAQAKDAHRHWSASPPPPPVMPVVPREPECEPPTDVPSSVVALAIRLRTELLTFADIAGRLTRLGQPAGHTWTPCEVRHIIAQEFSR